MRYRVSAVAGAVLAVAPAAVPVGHAEQAAQGAGPAGRAQGAGRGPVRPECVNPALPAAECNIPPGINWPDPPLGAGPFLLETAVPAAPQHPRGGRGDRAQPAVVDDLAARRHHARHRACRAAARHPQRRAGSDPGGGRARGARAGPAGSDGRGAAPALRGEPVGLPRVPQAVSRAGATTPQGAPLVEGETVHRARHLERHGADRRARHLPIGRHAHRVVAHRLRARRHAAHDHQRVGHRSRRDALRGSQRLRRQDRAPARRRQHPARQPVRGQGRLQAGHLHAGTPQRPLDGAQPGDGGVLGHGAGARTAATRSTC